MMKRKISAVVLLFTAFLLSANSQKWYAVSSSQWKTVNALSHYAGVSGPSSGGPVTQSQLFSAIERSSAVLSPSDEFLLYTLSLFEEGEAAVSDGKGELRFSLSLSPEAYLKTGKAEEESIEWDKDREWFIAPSRKRSPLFSILLDFSLLDSVYGVFDYNFSRDEFQDGIWNVPFSTNISSVHTESYPYNAGVAFGGNFWSVMALRGKASQGEGITGNTAVGDNYDYQEFVKGSFYTGFMGFYLRITNFDSSHDTSLTSNPYSLMSPRFSGYRQLRHEEQIEFMIAENLRISASLINLLDTTSGFDIRLLNPFSVIHNMFNYTDHTIFESNNMLTADISWTPIRKWNIYFQFTLDQAQSRGEVESYGEKLDPDAFAYLMNITYSDFVEEGVLSMYLEGVYTYPGMYLNSKYYRSASDSTIVSENTGLNAWSQDWLMGYWRGGGSYGDVKYSGYIWGPDALVVSLGGEYVRKNFSLETSLMYMAHGEKGRGRNLNAYTFDGIDSPSTYRTMAPSGIVEHTALLSLTGSYGINEYVSLSLGGAYSYMWNAGNTEGKEKGSLALCFGCTFSYDVPPLLRR